MATESRLAALGLVVRGSEAKVTGFVIKVVGCDSEVEVCDFGAVATEFVEFFGKFGVNGFAFDVTGCGLKVAATAFRVVFCTIGGEI